MKRILLTKTTMRLAALIAGDLLFFGLTDPQKTPSYMIILGFVLLASSTYSLLRFGFQGLSWYGIKIKHQQRLARLLTAVWMSIFALQSIGQLTNRDLLVLLPLVIIGYAYGSYAHFVKASE